MTEWKQILWLKVRKEGNEYRFTGYTADQKGEDNEVIVLASFIRNSFKTIECQDTNNIINS